MDKSLYPCTNCGKNHAPKRCPCYRASYCGPKCQNTHWGEHKGVCTVFLSRETKEQKSKHGTDSSESMEAQFNLALQYCDDHNDDKAEKTFRKYLDACNRIQLKTPPGWCNMDHVMDAHAGIAGIYRDRGSTDIARVHYEKALTICRQISPGEYHIIENLNAQIRCLCNGRRSVDEIKRSIARISDDDHDRLSYRNQELCLTYSENREIDMAITTGKKALEHVRKTTDRACEGSILILLADILCRQGRFDESLTFVEESLPILRRCMGDKGFGIGNALLILSRIYEGQYKFDDALKMIKKSLRYLRRSAGDKHTHTLMAAKQLVVQYMKRDMVEEMLEIFEKEEDLMRLALSDDYEWMLARAKGTIKDRNEIEAEYRAQGFQVERGPSWEWQA
jgi:tetratricopeptide (TPR) repeat protein